MESSWLTIPIQGIPELEHQSFRVIRAPDLTGQGKGEAKVEPRTVIDSRLTILAENFQSSGLWQPGAIGHGQLNYTWSYETPMGFVAKQNKIPTKLLRPSIDRLFTSRGRQKLTYNCNLNCTIFQR